VKEKVCGIPNPVIVYYYCYYHHHHNRNETRGGLEAASDSYLHQFSEGIF